MAPRLSKENADQNSHLAAFNHLLKTTEEEWYEILFHACKNQFSRVFLPSHDQWHHARVWEFAKKLLQDAVLQGILIHKNDVIDLMVAVFYHDQGMSITPSAEHGQCSSRLCKDFFNRSSFPNYQPGENVLNAIVAHDNKLYQNGKKIVNFDLKAFLNLADDLDAFGFIGAYRYAEIYLARSIDLTELPNLVLKNLSIRFHHLSDCLIWNHVFLEEQKHRYAQTSEFFINMEQQVKERKPDRLYGPYLVVSIIRDFVLEQKINPLQLIHHPGFPASDRYCLEFFHKLTKDYYVYPSPNIKIQ